MIIPKNIYISSLQENLRKFYTPAIFNSINLIKNGSKGRKQNENKKIYKGKISTHDMLINLNDTIEQALQKLELFHILTMVQDLKISLFGERVTKF